MTSVPVKGNVQMKLTSIEYIVRGSG